MMNFLQTTGIYFSPTGGTKNVVETMLSGFAGRTETLDLTGAGMRPVYGFRENEVVVAGAPVYAGRIPRTAVERFRQLRGYHTPAILIVTYGNRAYDDALAELAGVMREQGFVPVAAAAVICRHNIVPTIAADRPSASDIREIQAFVRKTEEMLKALPTGSGAGELQVPGKYREQPAKNVGFKIKVGGSCSGCGLCIRECPVQAISRTDPRITDEERCISCMRCVFVCPKKARGLGPLMEFAAKQKLKKMCAGQKQPEFYYL
ncbi:MAG: EFR1 family ferrodoxin [Clostridiales bacterium]|nr:EFR1 family ferrodoxin [Clostridiales bacterium]